MQLPVVAGLCHPERGGIFKPMRAADIQVRPLPKMTTNLIHPIPDTPPMTERTPVETLNPHDFTFDAHEAWNNAFWLWTGACSGTALAASLPAIGSIVGTALSAAWVLPAVKVMSESLSAFQPPTPDLPAESISKLRPVIAAVPVAVPAARLVTTPASSAAVRSGSSNLLHAPDFGKPDDLQQIKGVADVMERMLHGIGVYYFWQIAEWTPADVAHADEQLTGFHGRIQRDQWVSQARTLFAAPGAAQRPARL